MEAWFSHVVTATCVFAIAVAVSITLSAVAGCASPASGRGSSEPDEHVTDQGVSQRASQAAMFGDGTWTLSVDREWDRVSGNIRFPSDPLDESDYRPVADGPSYPVTVTQGASAVSIGDSTMAGTRDPDDDRYYYDLTEGVFAAGRFVVWSADGGLQAELTIYGSGVPIIQSERGAIEPLGEVFALYVPTCES